MDYTYRLPYGLIYSAQIPLTGVQDVLPEGEFLLPICTTRERLQKILSVLWEEREALPEVDDDPFSGANFSNIEHIMDVLQALAYINDPENAACYAPEIGDGNDCTMFLPETGFIQYAPNDPFQTPLLTPDGYLLPPWYTNPLVPLPGVLPTDAMVNFLAFPAFGGLSSIVDSGLPRFHIDFTGAGEVELEFVKVIQGGYVRVVVDGDELQQSLWDLNAAGLADVTPIETLFDIIIGESLSQTEVVELSFSTDVLHTIDVTFFPQLGTDVILGMGGGLRRVSLCGVTIAGEDTQVPQFRVVGCELQWRPNSIAAWEDLIDLCAVQPPTIVRQDQTPPGNLEQNIGGAGFTEIANTDLLWRNGLYPMIGGLEIYPTLGEEALTVRKTTHANPYDVARFQRADGGIMDRIFSDGEIGHDTTLGGFNGFSIYGGGFSVHYGSLTRTSILGVTDAGFTLMGKATLRPFQMLAFDNVTSTVYCTGKGGTVKNQIWRKSDIINYDNAWIGADGDGHFGVRNAANDVPDGVTLDHESTAAGGSGLGIALKMQGKSSTTSAQALARIYAVWNVATHASRQADMVFAVSDYAGEREAVRYRASGAAAMIGEYGHAPAVQQIVVGDTYGIPALNSLLGALAATGRVVNSTTSTSIPAPAAFNVSGDKFGNEALASLITGLDTANVINDLTSDTGAYVYEPPLPIDVLGSWEGLEVGKALALALDANEYINDLTELSSSDDVVIDRRCAATAACRWMIEQLYYLAGSEICYDNTAYVSESRWISVQAYVFPNGLHVETQDLMFERWGDPLYGEFGENSSPVVTFAEHFDELVAYLPTIEEAFYCSLTTSGILTSDGRLEFLDLMLATNLTGDVPQDIETWWYQFVRHFSAVDFGLFIAAALQSEYASTIDCSAFVCASSGFSWCKQYNFTLGTYTPPFEIVSGDHVFGATFNPGWKTDDAGILRIEFPFPTNQVTIKYNVTIPDDAYVVLFGSLDGGFEANLSVEGGIYEETIEIPEAFRELGWYFRAACNPVNCVVTIKLVTNMQGTGIEPTDLNDC